MARSSKGGRYRKSAKIEALRECKEEILEAHRSGISIHRIAQIFRERNVDISTQHLMRAIRLFIAEGEGTKGKGSVVKETGALEEAQKAPVTYRVPEPASALVREEEFAKQLRLARYLAGASLPPTRPLESGLKPKAPKQERSGTKAGSKAKAGPARQKTGEAELAKERRRAGRQGHQVPTTSRRAGERQRASPGR